MPLTAATGRIEARIRPAGWTKSTAPLRACDSRSLSPPSWLAGKIVSVMRPPVSFAMRSDTSSSRLWNGCPAGLECPILYSNSAAWADRLGSIAAAVIAVDAATKLRRVIFILHSFALLRLCR